MLPLDLESATATVNDGTTQVPDPGNYSPACYKLGKRRVVMVPMRDGVRLSAAIYSPALPGRLPTILSITPYGNALFNSHPRMNAKWFAKRGYVFVGVEARGRARSGGRWDPFNRKHKTDGYDLVEWVARQPWSNGKVGMLGMCYQAYTQWWTASTAPPHLTTIVPQVALPDAFENIPYQHGVLVGAWWLNWCGAMSGVTSVDGGWNQEDFKHTPYININSYRGGKKAPWFHEMYRQNRSIDPYWSGIAYQGEENYSRITVPTLALGGWFDANFPGTELNYLGMKRFGGSPQARRPHMIIGPWVHDINHRVVGGIDYGEQATFDVDGYTMRWLDHYLKGIDNGVEKDPPVYVFVMGENRWYAEKDWPLPHARPTKYYLSSGGRANSLKGDGLLSTELSVGERFDSYDYDPRNPTLDPFGMYPGHNGTLDGALDTQLSASGVEVLVYQTSPLESAIEVTGPIEATLFAATSAADTDWMIRLVDVQPDGRSLLITEGVIRARNRDPDNEGRFNAAHLSRIKPDKVYRYTIRFWRATGNLFQIGHRIRIEISSSWYPYFLPNLNTGADNLAMVSISEACVAHQTIHHGPRFPSHILLPIVSRCRSGARRPNT